MNQAELEQDIERFTGSFLERIADAMAKLEDSDRPEIRDAALKRNLLYASSAVEIASGALPEVDLLDMVVFVHLSRVTVDEYWIPDVYGAAGRCLADAFEKSESEIWAIADKIMSEPEKARLIAILDEWRAENPTQIRVEGVRFLEFSKQAGALAKKRAEEVSGLMSSVKGATQRADQALMLGERAMFLVHRMPFLVRLQARLASREIIADAMVLLRARIAEIASSLRQAHLLRRAFPYLVAAGGALSLSWLGKYFVAKRMLGRR